MSEIKKDELKGYSNQDFHIDIKRDGLSGVIINILTEETPEESIENEIKILPWKGIAKVSTDIYRKFTPVFFRRNFTDLDSDIISKVRTFEEIQVEAEKERGYKFGNTIEEKRLLKELYIKGDIQNRGYLKIIDKKDLSGTIYKKYIPEYGVYIGLTEATKNLLTESPHNYEVFTAVYNLTYRYVINRYEKTDLGESFFHMPLFGFNRIKIKKDDIYNELGWDKTDRWDRLKIENGLYYLKKIHFNLELVNQKEKRELSPFFINYGTTEDGYITFSANEIYFRGVEKHIIRKIQELSREETINVKKGELEEYITEEEFINGESPETHDLKMFIKTQLRDEGKTNKKPFNIEISISSLLMAIGVNIQDKKNINRKIKKLSLHLDEIKKSGFISSYSPNIRKGYRRLGMKIRFKKT